MLQRGPIEGCSGGGDVHFSLLCGSFHEVDECHMHVHAHLLKACTSTGGANVKVEKEGSVHVCEKKEVCICERFCVKNPGLCVRFETPLSSSYRVYS